MRTPKIKAALLEKFEDEAEKVESQFDRGIITDEERRQKEIEVWTEATFRVRDAMQEEMHEIKFNPIDMMVGSGARGDLLQVQQIAGMRGLVANPRGEIIPRPIKSSFREGLSVLEYFISTHGARKGLADTALRTADSGYLTRRLVDVAQELIVREDDCESPRGIWVENLSDDPETLRILDTKLLGRSLVDDMTLADGTVLPRNTEVREPELRALASDPTSTGCGCVRCSRASRSRVCARRVTARCSPPASSSTRVRRSASSPPSRSASPARSSPCVRSTPAVSPVRTSRTACLVSSSSSRPARRRARRSWPDCPASCASARTRRASGSSPSSPTTGPKSRTSVTRRTHLYPGIADGVEVQAGQQLTGDFKTPIDPKKMLEVKGIRETQQYLSDEVQKVYREQGVSIHDKHVEVIVRQMLRRVGVSESGDSKYLPGQKADAREFADINRRLVAEGKQPAEGRPELMGITKASLATDSWLSAASFQETTRVLTEAAIEGRRDSLVGLKENVIIGKLIPAGTGMNRYRDIDTHAPDYEPLPFYSSDTDADGDLDLAAWLADTSAIHARRGRRRVRGGRRAAGGEPVRRSISDAESSKRWWTDHRQSLPTGTRECGGGVGSRMVARRIDVR